jgi:hypothetical protein
MKNYLLFIFATLYTINIFAGDFKTIKSTSEYGIVAEHFQDKIRIGSEILPQSIPYIKHIDNMIKNIFIYGKYKFNPQELNQIARAALFIYPLHNKKMTPEEIKKHLSKDETELAILTNDIYFKLKKFNAANEQYNTAMSRLNEKSVLIIGAIKLDNIFFVDWLYQEKGKEIWATFGQNIRKLNGLQFIERNHRRTFIYKSFGFKSITNELNNILDNLLTKYNIDNDVT